MNEYELFTQPHDELQRIAADIGVVNVPALTAEQLVHAIVVAQSAQKQGIPWAQTPEVIFQPDEESQKAYIGNSADRPVRLSLEAMDPNGVFIVPPELKAMVLQGNDTLSVPVRLSLPKPSQGGFS